MNIVLVACKRSAWQDAAMMCVAGWRIVCRGEDFASPIVGRSICLAVDG